MFNEERKIAFIRETCNSVSTRDHYYSLFRATEPHEIKHGDVCSWDTPITKSFFGTRTANARTIRERLNQLKRYCQWCIQNGYKESGNIMQVKLDDLLGTTAFRSCMVKNPASLSKYLDAAFEAAENKGKSCLTFRAYQWFAFCGVHELVAFSITKNEIDLKNRTILINGFERKIVQEAFETISGLCKGADHDTPILTFENPKYESGRISSSISSRHNPNIKKLLYRDVYKSGVFYRAYCQEMLGFPVRFDEEIEFQISVTGYDGIGNSLRKRENILNATLKREYEMWKTAFSLDT